MLLRTKIIIPGIVVVAVAAVTSVALASSDGKSANDFRASASSPQSYAAPSQVIATLQSSFSALRRPQTPSDAIPATLLAGLGPSQGDVGWAPSFSRLVLSNADASAWLLPANGVLCVLASFGPTGASGPNAASFACKFTAAAQTSGIYIVHNGDIAGVLPDGSGAMTVKRQDGSSTKLVPNSDGAIAQTSAQSVTSISYTGANGAMQQTTLPAAPAPPTPPSSPLS